MNRGVFKIFGSISQIAIAAVLSTLAGVAQLSAQNVPTTVSVNATANQHAIDPRVYGSNWLVTADITKANFPTNRFGGNNNSDYNWEQDALNIDSDWYFETYAYSRNPTVPGGEGDNFIESTHAANLGAEPIITIPMMPYVATIPTGDFYSGCGVQAWSFSIRKYGAQTGSDSSNCPDAGNGVSKATGKNITNNDPLDTYVPNSVSLQQGWLAHLIGKWGNSQYPNGIKYYALDNEPSLWSSTHRDMHPATQTYDELWSDLQAYGAAVKAADPNAYIMGPEEWSWEAMWKSGHDQSTGTGSGSDYATHNNTYYYPWLLQQLAAFKAAHGYSLIDGLSVHCYTDAGSNWNVATRILWDPTYKSPNWEGNLGLNSGILEWIPLMKSWVNAAFPNGDGPDIGCTEWSNSNTGTMTDVTFQADNLGLFGYYGFNFANYWGNPPPNFAVLAEQMFRNYDGNYSLFGDTSVQTTVANPDNLSSFSAVRSTDGALTVMVINKQSGTTPATIALTGFTAGSSATAYQVTSLTQDSPTNIGSVTPVDNTISATLPGQSVTLYVIPAATSAPVSPIGLTATAGDAQVQLSWTASDSTTDYQVWYKAADGSYTEAAPAVAATSYVVTGLTNGTSYSFYVTASSNLGTSGPSNTATAVPLASAPNPPTGLTATPGGGAVALSWTASSNATSYQVWYGITGIGSYHEATSTVTATSYTVTGLSNGTSYTFYVTASNSNGITASDTVTATPSLVVPGTPTAVIGNTEVLLSWTGTVGATSYSIERATSSTGNYSVTASGITENMYNKTGVGTTSYYYKVAAVYPSGTSAYSAAVHATASNSAPSIPGTPTATAGDGQVALTWTDSSTGTVTNYQVWYGAVGGSSYTEATSTLANNATTYTVTGLTNGTKYTFFVVAANGTTYGSASAQATATPVGLPQTITFTPPPSPVMYGVSPITLTATGGDSGNPVVFSLDSTSTSGAASLSGTNNSVLTITGVGTVVVDANQAGTAAGSGYSPAPQVQQKIVVNQATQDISFTAASPVTYGVSPVSLVATGGLSGNPVTFSVLSGPGSVSGTNGATLSIVGAGTVVVAANQAGNTYYSAASQVTSSITVNPAVLTVTANSTSKATGAANPTFTASYNGFVNGDTSAALSGSPSLTTTATTSSAAGTYTIKAALGTLTAANYAFTFVNGTLSVVTAPAVTPTVTATLTGSASSGYTLTLTLHNPGTGTISNATLTSATLGTATGSPLPQGAGTIAAGGSATFTVNFQGSAGADGAGVAEKYSGTYSGGSFSASLRSVILP